MYYWTSIYRSSWAAWRAHPTAPKASIHIRRDDRRAPTMPISLSTPPTKNDGPRYTDPLVVWLRLCSFVAQVIGVRDLCLPGDAN